MNVHITVKRQSHHVIIIIISITLIITGAINVQVAPSGAPQVTQECSALSQRLQEKLVDTDYHSISMRNKSTVSDGPAFMKH